MKKIQAVLLIFLLAGCSSNQPAAPTIPSIPPAASPLPTETILPATQSLTLTPTSVPAFTSPPLFTPLPTLSSMEAEEKLRLWIAGALDCLLPCWGGITPGVTTWAEARQVIEQLSGFATVNVSENLNCEFGACNGIAWSLYPNTLAEGTFYTKLPENIVHLININIQNEGNAQKINLLRPIGLKEAFKWYGLPPIFLMTVETNLAENRFMKLVLVYPEQQSIIRYTKNTEVVDGNVTNCGQDHQIELIILANKEQLASLDAIANAVETRDLHIDDRYKTVEEATGISANTFFETFSTTNDACISTPVGMWTP
ncbi:MAG TPA: hypothetical protein VJM08_01615 [Anaerolineales bacterium]|nr:hypothetical protein [Anaerolineales bacterium]